MRAHVILASACALVATAACATDPAPGTCVEDHVTIAQGLYGLVTYQTDVAPEANPPMPVAGEAIAVLDMPGGSPVAETASDAAGVFQIELAAGSYALCYSSISSCVTFDVAANALVRADLHEGFASTWELVPRARCGG